MSGIAEPRFQEPDYNKAGFFRSIFLWIQGRSNVVVVDESGPVAATTWMERVDASGGAVTRTLPSAGNGVRELRFIKTDASGNAVTISRSGSDVINGANTQSLAAQYDSVTVVADGTTNWDIT